MAVAFVLTVVLGFSNSAHHRAVTGAPPLDPRVMLHAALFASWFVIFFVQTTLVASGRIATHRRLGYVFTVIAALILVNGPLTAVSGARRGALGPDGLAFMLLMIGDVVGFATFVALAIYYRGRAETHKRLMLLGTMSILPPAITRWPFVLGNPAAIGVVMLAFLLAAPVRDLLARRRVHRVSLWGGLALLASGPLRIAVSQSAAWHHFASWLIR